MKNILIFLLNIFIAILSIPSAFIFLTAISIIVIIVVVVIILLIPLFLLLLFKDKLKN
jgi:hypothetical protein